MNVALELLLPRDARSPVPALQHLGRGGGCSGGRGGGRCFLLPVLRPSHTLVALQVQLPQRGPVVPAGLGAACGVFLALHEGSALVAALVTEERHKGASLQSRAGEQHLPREAEVPRPGCSLVGRHVHAQAVATPPGRKVLEHFVNGTDHGGPFRNGNLLHLCAKQAPVRRSQDDVSRLVARGPHFARELHGGAENLPLVANVRFHRLDSEKLPRGRHVLVGLHETECAHVGLDGRIDVAGVQLLVLVGARRREVEHGLFFSPRAGGPAHAGVAGERVAAQTNGL